MTRSSRPHVDSFVFCSDGKELTRPADRTLAVLVCITKQVWECTELHGAGDYAEPGRSIALSPCALPSVFLVHDSRECEVERTLLLPLSCLALLSFVL